MEYRLVTPKNVIHLSVGEAASDCELCRIRTISVSGFNSGLEVRVLPGSPKHQ